MVRPTPGAETSAREARALGGGVDELDALVDPLDGRRLRRDLDADRVLEEALGEAGDLGRHGGGEERRLPARMQARDDLPDRLDEAHVEHPVGLVEHDEAGLVEHDRAVVHQVGEPARRRDDDVDAAGEGADLGAPRHAAEDEEGGKPGAAGHRPEACLDLDREFAGRREDQRPAGLGRHAPGHVEELVQDRQREGRGLAGAGLGDAEDVAAGELRRDRLGLDRRRRVEAGPGEAVEERLGEAEVREGLKSSQCSFPRGRCRCGCRPRQAHVTKTAIGAMPGPCPTAPSRICRGRAAPRLYRRNAALRQEASSDARVRTGSGRRRRSPGRRRSSRSRPRSRSSGRSARTRCSRRRRSARRTGPRRCSRSW